MCTLIVCSRVWPDTPLVVAANRDEQLGRPAGPPRAWPGRSPALFAPEDHQAGGTWLGLNAAGLFAGVTNRFGVTPPEPGRRSRGLLVLDALAERDPAAAAGRVLAHPPRLHNRFHLMLASRDAAVLVWSDGERLERSDLEPGPRLRRPEAVCLIALDSACPCPDTSNRLWNLRRHMARNDRRSGAKMGKERRRSPRLDTQLRVRIPRAPHAVEGKTRDVSRHGVFVQSIRDLPERQLIQVELTIPDEPLPVPMMAMVTRVVAGDVDAEGGFALDFYALEKGSMAAWERYVDRLEQERGVAPGRRRSTESMPAAGPRLGLRVSTIDRLVEIYHQGIRKQELWLPAAGERPSGQRLEIVLVHPNSHDRFSIFGQVVGKDRSPLGESGLKITLFPLSRSADKRLRDFISGGNSEIARKLKFKLH